MKAHKSLKLLSAAEVEAAVEGAHNVMPSTPPSPSLLTEMRSHVDAAISGVISQNEFRLRVEKSIASRGNSDGVQEKTSNTPNFDATLLTIFKELVKEYIKEILEKQLKDAVAEAMCEVGSQSGFMLKPTDLAPYIDIKPCAGDS